MTSTCGTASGVCATVDGECSTYIHSGISVSFIQLFLKTLHALQLQQYVQRAVHFRIMFMLSLALVWASSVAWCIECSELLLHGTQFSL